MILDIHSHILPNVDDGARNYEEGIELLKMIKSQGAEAVVATPHFDLTNPKAEAERKRIISIYNELCEMADDKKMPEIFLGFELFFFHGMSEMPDLDKYTIAGTDRILIELPHGRMTAKMAAELEEIAFSRKLTPVLAHLERYNRYEGIDKIYDEVLSGVAEAQITADMAADYWSRKKATKLINQGLFTYLGSDSHSCKTRPPMLDKFLKFSSRHHKDFYGRMQRANRKLYPNMKKPV